LATGLAARWDLNPQSYVCFQGLGTSQDGAAGFAPAFVPVRTPRLDDCEGCTSSRSIEYTAWKPSRGYQARLCISGDSLYASPVRVHPYAIVKDQRTNRTPPRDGW